MTDETAVDELLAPIRSAIESEYARRALFGSIGWDVDALPEARVVDALETINDAATALIGFIDDPPESLSEFGEALQAANDLADGFIALEDAVGDTTEIPPDIYAALGEDLFTQIVILYLDSNHPVLLRVAVFLTLIRPVDPMTRSSLTLNDGTIVRYPSPALDFDFEHVADLLTDPVETLKAEYDLDGSADEEEFQRRLTEQLFPLVTVLLSATGGGVSYSTENLGFFEPFDSFGTELGWIRVDYDLGTTNFNVRVHIYSDDGDVTLVVVPGGDAVVTQRLGQWAVTLALDSTADEVAIDADSVQFPDTTGRVGVSLRALKIPSTDFGDSFVVGGTEGTRLELGRLGVEGHADIESEQEYGIVARASDSTFALDTNDGDDFLSEVFPEELRADFDLGLGWSTRHGVHLDGSRTLEQTLPIHLSLGELLLLNELSVSVSPDSETARIPVYVATTATAQLGPVTATVERVGIEAEFSFPEEGGNLGPMNVDLGFKPPDCIAVSVDAEVVTGGGFLDYDPEHERYSGVVDLTIGEITINAIGLLSTDVPGSETAYSFIVIIAGDFPPIDLGLGFRLTGAGGIVGLHRSVKAEPLGEVVRDGSLDSVLFPEDPVANAERILSDLQRIFPVTADTHVFGPIVRIEWGTPTKLTADLGVVLELPSWKIAILGNFQSILPDEDAALLTLNMAATGTIDPDEQRVDVDASLYDSRLVSWTLSGDMALRTKRGDDPRFVLSIGGFNPRFDPPSSVPELETVKATLGPSSGNPTLEYSGYFAITANTVQAGAGVHAVVEAGPAVVEGKLSFDALIEFDPFGFIADFHASVSVKVKGKGFSIDLDGTISGLGPFRIQAKIEISLFLFSVSASVDVKLGSGATFEVPRARIMPELEEALGQRSNWTTQLPDTDEKFAVLRDIEGDGESVIAHPLAEIGVRQTVVPFGFEVEKFGEATPAEYTRFELAEARVEGATLELTAETEEYFAPAQYSKLSDAERLDSPAFEIHPAGRKMRDHGVYLGYVDEEGREANLRESTLEYTCVVFDRAGKRDGVPLSSLGGFTDSLSGFDAGVVAALEDVGAVANSPARRTGSRRFRLSETDKLRDQAVTDGTAVSRMTVDGSEQLHRGGANPDVGGVSGRISMSSDRYVIVEGGSLTPVNIPTAPATQMSKATAKRALSRYRARNPTHARSLKVVPASKTTMEEIQ